MTYPEFISEDIRGSYKVTLNQPKNPDGSKAYITKLGPFVHVNVEVEILAIYTRSVELFLTFEGLNIRKIFYTPFDKGPDVIHADIYQKIDKLVNKALLEDGREEWIREEYRKKQERINTKIQEIVGKIKEIDDRNKEDYLQD
jgi:hypothetical protein